MQEYYQPEQAFSISMPQPVFEISKISVFWFQWSTTQREEENRAKDQVILHVDKLTLYFLRYFCWYFHKVVWWFYFNEISNCCVFASLPVYSNLPVY